MLTPDAYEGAPTPVTAFLSTASKAAGFAVIFRVFAAGMLGAPVADRSNAWWTILVAMCIVTMTLGNLLAIYQTSIKRMLAYSSIAQAGYASIGLVTFAADGLGDARAAGDADAVGAAGPVATVENFAAGLAGRGQDSGGAESSGSGVGGDEGRRRDQGHEKHGASSKGTFQTDRFRIKVTVRSPRSARSVTFGQEVFSLGKGEDTRARILDEAMRQVSVRGMTGVSLGDLATGMNLSKSGVLKHFQSMETLQLALLDAMTDRFVAEVWKPAEPFASGRERLVK